MSFTVTPIGTVLRGRADTADTDHWGAVTSTILVEERFGHDCLQGLADFSHVEVIFVFDQAVERDDHRPRRPRGRADLPEVGIFADRGPRRPNRIGVTICPILSVDQQELTVRSLDAVEGTPVLDLKPVMAEFLPAKELHQPAWATTLMVDYFRS